MPILGAGAVALNCDLSESRHGPGAGAERGRENVCVPELCGRGRRSFPVEVIGCDNENGRGGLLGRALLYNVGSFTAPLDSGMSGPIQINKFGFYRPRLIL